MSASSISCLTTCPIGQLSFVGKGEWRVGVRENPKTHSKTRALLVNRNLESVVTSSPLSNTRSPSGSLHVRSRRRRYEIKGRGERTCGQEGGEMRSKAWEREGALTPVEQWWWTVGKTTEHVSTRRRQKQGRSRESRNAPRPQTRFSSPSFLPSH